MAYSGLFVSAILAFVCPVLLLPGGPSETVILRIQQLIAAGDLVTARDQLGTALRHNPGEGGLYNLLGIVEASENHYAAAAIREDSLRWEPLTCTAAITMPPKLSCGRSQTVRRLP